MKISVITVTYNNANNLEKTILSVKDQHFNDFEYIIVDGNSSDNSIDIIKKHEKSITKWISEPDTGIYNAMNKAVHLASGEYCIFMNAGDVFANQLVLKQVSLFLNDNYDVLTGCEISTKDGKIIDYIQPITKITKEHFFQTSISHQASFIKRTLLLECPYDETLKLVSDWKFWLQTIVFGGRTYRPIDVDICIFNHDGITFSMTETGKIERNKVIHEIFNKEDISKLSKKYNCPIYHIKEKIFRRVCKNRNTHISTIKRKTKTIYSYIKVLGPIGILVSILNSLKNNKCNYIVQKIISNFIRRQYSQYITEEKLSPPVIIKEGKTPIWFCWWQGEKLMPIVPKICIKRLRENLRKNQYLIVIDKYNYKQFINIPSYIINNVSNGSISITNFSDILRSGLLAKYGGLWIDATCYTTSTIPDISSFDFFSSKKNVVNDYSYISNYRWASYLIGGNQRLIFANMYYLFIKYCEHEKVFVDYLLVDYFLNLIYEKSSLCKESIQKLETSEPNILILQKQINKKYNKTDFPNGIFHKLSWKTKNLPYTDTMQKTFWGDIIEKI